MQNHVFNDLALPGKGAVEFGEFPGHLADAANRKTDGSAAKQAPAVAVQAEIVGNQEAQRGQIDHGRSCPWAINPAQKKARHCLRHASSANQDCSTH